MIIVQDGIPIKVWHRR